ncbi:transcriptional regulator, MarR family [Arcobacter nitrofigilis DSM 7299]|uniref:Transcriptional regulator, MarR family n=1 Tax=Arcobacter nitrofigilis (strain ATCC 33309 / DSM 7299 / CCUG 15893 / LMG 7604 / NCTC 12251 / CI) TaxID=572480 RepID=D5V729_ARCNC|nr:MarR family transcriptional regulator [Arcobacter nitrofigilis]ADG94449.1 transcriptional regulator, MarR family [Arcobacter nitrofigilis DSM 7299]
MKKELIALASKVTDLSNKLIISQLEKNNINGIVPSHGSIFILLYENEQVTMKDIADFVHKTKPTVTILVDKLVKMGYVKKEKSKTDSRVTFVELTQKGKDLKPVFEEISNNINNIIYKNLTTNEAVQTEKTLRKVIANLNFEDIV